MRRQAAREKTSPAPIERVSGLSTCISALEGPGRPSFLPPHTLSHSLFLSSLLSYSFLFVHCVVAHSLPSQPPCSSSWGSFNCLFFFFVLCFLSSFLPISSQGLLFRLGCPVTSLFWNRNRTTLTRPGRESNWTFSSSLTLFSFRESCSGRPVLFTNRHHGVVVSSPKECLCGLSGRCEASCVPVTGL